MIIDKKIIYFLLILGSIVYVIMLYYELISNIYYEIIIIRILAVCIGKFLDEKFTVKSFISLIIFFLITIQLSFYLIRPMYCAFALPFVISFMQLLDFHVENYAPSLYKRLSELCISHVNSPVSCPEYPTRNEGWNFVVKVYKDAHSDMARVLANPSSLRYQERLNQLDTLHRQTRRCVDTLLGMGAYSHEIETLREYEINYIYLIHSNKLAIIPNNQQISDITPYLLRIRDTRSEACIRWQLNEIVIIELGKVMWEGSYSKNLLSIDNSIDFGKDRLKDGLNSIIVALVLIDLKKNKDTISLDELESSLSKHYSKYVARNLNKNLPIWMKRFCTHSHPNNDYNAIKLKIKNNLTGARPSILAHPDVIEAFKKYY